MTMHRRERVGSLLLAVALLAVLAGGVATAVARAPGHGRRPEPVAAPHPHPTQAPPTPPPSPLAQTSTVCHLGAAATLLLPDHSAVVRVLVVGPVVSTQALSSYAYGPAFGYYDRFRVLIVDLGPSDVIVDPLTFTAATAGYAPVNIFAGNAKFSGSSTSLEHTFILPHTSESGPLTFDLHATTGVLSWAPQGHLVCSWSF
ncbi:MAG: hypothetical protein ACYDB7_00995 [Mycobacteriales bacterium]